MPSMVALCEKESPTIAYPPTNPYRHSMDPGVAVALVIALTTIGTMAAMARSQPWQSVIFAFLWISLFSMILPNLLAPIPRWITPIFWSNVLLNSRGLAKLILRRWRATEFYGYWLIAVTSVLSLVPLLPLTISGLPVWFASAAILQLLSIPWLIEKKPVVPPPNWWRLWPWTFLSAAAFIYARWHATQ